MRRLTLAVVGKGKGKGGSAGEPIAPAVATADAIDNCRGLRGYRPTATGRAPVLGPGRDAWAIPETALVEETRRDRLRGWILRAGPEAASLAPADASGLSWSAIRAEGRPSRPGRTA